MATHDRPGLEQKIIVDTPDLDSNDLTNRDKLFACCPWPTSSSTSARRRNITTSSAGTCSCSSASAGPLPSSSTNGTAVCTPALAACAPIKTCSTTSKRKAFKTRCSFAPAPRHWVDHPWQNNGTPQPPVEGEQFVDLVHWLEEGLTRLEIEAIKARGVSQMLRQLQEALTAACPPDLTQIAERTHVSWARLIDEEAQTQAAILLNTLEPYQKEIEHHFALERQRQFKGPMGTYLHYFNKLKYSGSSLRDRLPFMPRLPQAVAPPKEWDLSNFTQACSSVASEQHLDARSKALANHLLVAADGESFPVALLTEPTEAVAKLDWRTRHAQAMIEVLGAIQHTWSKPKGLRRVFQAIFIPLADWLPMLAVFLMGGLLIWITP